MGGCSCEVLSSILQSMRSEKSKDLPQEMPSMWNCNRAEQRSVCKDLNAISRIIVVDVCFYCCRFKVRGSVYLASFDSVLRKFWFWTRKQLVNHVMNRVIVQKNVYY